MSVISRAALSVERFRLQTDDAHQAWGSPDELPAGIGIHRCPVAAGYVLRLPGRLHGRGGDGADPGAPESPKETLVLFDHNQPVGSAGLAARPDLTPWLAGVFVLPAFRGHGYATALAQRVEALALAASVPVLWLYTSTAEPLSVRLGWRRVGMSRTGVARWR